MPRSTVIAVLCCAALAACSGSDEGSAESVRTVAVAMHDDMRFEPSALGFAVGETVAFEVTNEGSVPHEWFIADLAGQEEHAAEMAETGGMDHEQPGSVTVEPGATETVEYTFEHAGTLLGACHEPGHYEAGMVVPITVEDEPS